MSRKLLRQWSWTWMILWFGFALLTRGRGGEFHLEDSLRGPEGIHLLGFDVFGRDLLLTVSGASLSSGLFAVLATGAALLAGLLIGTGLPLLPRWAEYGILRTLDFLLAFPPLLFALAWAAISGPGWNTLLFSLLIGSIPSVVRMTHVRTRELLREDFILSARSLGASTAHLFRQHLFPGNFSFVSVKIPNLFAQTLLAEATLSFMGIGAPLGARTWGSLLAQGKDYLIEAPHLTLGAGLPLVLTVLALQNLTRSEL